MKLPQSFRSLLWSYDFSEIDSEKDKKIIIVNAINYGDLEHWRWLVRQYGKETVKNTLENIPATEIRPRALKLAVLIFSLRRLNHAPRST